MPVHILERPDDTELEDFLREHLSDGRCLVQVFAECEVHYAGRAMSTADAGDYLVIVKCDGSLQVHGSRGYKPRNWQPRTDALHVGTDDGRVVLTAERFSPHEFVRVVMLDVHLAQALALRDETGFVLRGSEAEMQQVLRQHPDLIEDGLELLDSELPTGVGDVDLYARDALGRIVVVELKRAKATQEAVHQLERYVATVRQETGLEVRGILAAPSVTAPARAQLERSRLEFVELTALPEPDAPAVVQHGLFDAEE